MPGLICCSPVSHSDGGRTDEALQYVHRKNGIRTSQSYPYSGQEQQCKVRRFSLRQAYACGGTTAWGTGEVPAECTPHSGDSSSWMRNQHGVHRARTTRTW